MARVQRIRTNNRAYPGSNESSQSPLLSQQFASFTTLMLFVASVLGAALGTVATGWIAINYTEKFKAEENLRTFAFSEAYKPLKASLQKCQDLRKEALYNAGRINVTNETIGAYLQGIETLSETPAGGALLASMKEVVEQYNKSSVALAESYLAISNCDGDSKAAGHELATLLNINGAYSVLVKKLDSERPSWPNLSEKNEENVLMRMLANPKLVAALARAFGDASEGDVVRGLSALNKIRSELRKSTRSGKLALAYQHKSMEHGSIIEARITEFFLVEFRERFARMPEFSPLKALQDAQAR